jgi:hypothetical protein
MDAAWEPANDVERALLTALTDTDQQRYFAVLAGAPLLMPAAGSADGPQLVVWSREQMRYVLVFTSLPALHSLGLSGVELVRPTTYAEMVGTLTGPGWGLAVDPHLPIGVWVPLEDVARAARAEIMLPGLPWPLPGD